MGILEMPADAPDTYGIPEYHVSEVRTEIDGTDVRMVFGTKRFGQTQWLYTVVVNPERLLALCHYCQSAAEEAFNLAQMMDRRRRAGH